jgi:hypothetical protein
MDRLEEADVLEGDIYGLIAPYATANLWVSWPKFTFAPHRRICPKTIWNSLRVSGGRIFAYSITAITMLFSQTKVHSKISSQLFQS